MTMAPLAARRVAEMVALGDRIVALELAVAAQATELRGIRLGRGTAQAVTAVRTAVPSSAIAIPFWTSSRSSRSSGGARSR